MFWVGMAIFTRLADIRLGPTLMGRVLPGPIRNRVEYGLKKKKKNPKRVRVLLKKPRPDPYKNLVPKITKIP